MDTCIEPCLDAPVHFLLPGETQAPPIHPPNDQDRAGVE
jgi:hypothetical protein